MPRRGVHATWQRLAEHANPADAARDGRGTRRAKGRSMDLDNASFAATVSTAVSEPAIVAQAAAPSRLDQDMPSLAILQRRYIDRVLDRAGRNKTRAARMLGIDRRTLNRMLARERARQASVKVG